MPENLKKQLERARFERALEVAESLADHRALLTTSELSRLNDILTGSKRDSNVAPVPGGPPWRHGPVTLTLPSGRTETLSLIADPTVNAREILHRATEIAERGGPTDAIDAAVDAYAGFVLSHVFEDANRRTAVCAAHYFLRRYGVLLSGMALHELGLGDLREEGQLEVLRDTVRQMSKFAAKQQRPR